MEPGLLAGSFVLIHPRAVPRVGDIVVATHPLKMLTIVKRIETIASDGLLELRSDNTDHGTDSRHFGLVDPDLLIGKATLVLEWPPRVL